MEMLKRYFTKRYFLMFVLFYVIWYPGAFVLSTLYETIPNIVFYIALNVYYPAVLALVAYFYFRKSPNDWNDRFITAFGWTAMALLITAAISQPVYGYSWTLVLNWEVIKGNWLGIFLILSAAFFARKKIA